MRKFEVYNHPALKMKIVKVGFSWPGFFFTFFWAMFKRMWLIGCGLLAFYIIASFSFDLSGNDFDSVFNLAANIIIPLWFGFKGNDLYTKYLTKRGYTCIWSGEAKSKEDAIALHMRDSTDRVKSEYSRA